MNEKSPTGNGGSLPTSPTSSDVSFVRSAGKMGTPTPFTPRYRSNVFSTAVRNRQSIFLILAGSTSTGLVSVKSTAPRLTWKPLDGAMAGWGCSLPLSAPSTIACKSHRSTASLVGAPALSRCVIRSAPARCAASVRVRTAASCGGQRACAVQHRTTTRREHKMGVSECYEHVDDECNSRKPCHTWPTHLPCRRTWAWPSAWSCP